MLEITTALTNEERHVQMAEAIKHGFPTLQRRGSFHDAKAQIICFGPSLLDTWRMIKPEVTKVTVSGAHDFLMDRNIQPTYHVEIDPRAHKPKMLRHPRKDTTYLMASVCHPDFWDVLEGHDVRLWHLVNDYETVDWVKQHHPEGVNSVIGGGSTVGQRAMNVMSALGYRRFAIFGMDSSFTDDHHAGLHTGPHQPEIKVELGNRVFRTTPHLWQQARQMAEFLARVDVEVEFYGDGMMQELARIMRKRKRSL